MLSLSTVTAAIPWLITSPLALPFLVNVHFTQIFAQVANIHTSILFIFYSVLPLFDLVFSYTIDIDLVAKVHYSYWISFWKSSIHTPLFFSKISLSACAAVTVTSSFSVTARRHNINDRSWLPAHDVQQKQNEASQSSKQIYRTRMTLRSEGTTPQGRIKEVQPVPILKGTHYPHLTNDYSKSMRIKGENHTFALVLKFSYQFQFLWM